MSQQPGIRLAFLPLLLFVSFTFANEFKLAPVSTEFQKWELENSNRCIPCENDESEIDHRLGLIPDPSPFTTLPAQSRTVRALPATYDLRNVSSSNYVSTVKNQTTCGACWSFATMASIESAMMLDGLGEVDYSENNLKNNHGWSNGPCAGGHTSMSIAYLSRFDGPKLESDEPYVPADDRPSPVSETQRYVTDVEVFAGNDEIKQAIIDHGALYTTMSWQDAGYNSSNKTFYYPSKVTINHAVTVVGWDDTKATAAPNPGAWLIKNSWGTGWGDAGYFWIAYEDQSSVFDAHAFSKTVSNKYYSSNYYYDTLGNTTGLSAKYGANLFTAHLTEDLSAVGIYARADFTTYEIRVYDDYANGQFYNQLGTTVTGSLDNAGYYTIELPEKIRLTQGDDFAIAVKFGNSIESYILPIEYPFSSAPAVAQSGQSFVSSTAINTGFVDITQQFPNTNVCIKAYTKAINNNAPVLSAVTNQTVDEDGSIILALNMVTATDSDNDPLTLFVENGSDYTVTGTTVKPTANFNGTLTVPVKVSDGMDFSNTMNMTITVSAINDKPVILSITDQKVAEDYVFDITESMITTQDVDGDDLTILVKSGANYTVSGMRITPDKDYYGPLTVPIQLFDGQLYSVVDYMTIDVKPINDAPYISGHGEVILDEDQIFMFSIQSLKLEAYDPDNHVDDLEVICEDGDHYVIDGKDIVLEADYNGYITIPVKVTDGELTSGIYDVKIKIRNVNDLPLFTALFNQTTNEDTPVTLSMTMATVIDIDGDALSIVVDTGANYTVKDSVVTPDPNFFGELTVPIRITDGIDTTLTINMAITVNGVNDAPLLQDIPIMSMNEDATLLLSQGLFPVSDPDNSTLTMILGNGANYTLSGTTVIPTANWNGTLQVPVTFSDGSLQSATKTLEIVVLSVNDLPQTVVTIQNQYVDQFADCYMEVPVNPFTDIEDGVLPVSYVEGLPSGVSYNGTHIIGAPQTYGTFNIDLIGRDSNGGEGSIGFTLFVRQKEATVKELLTDKANPLAVAPIPVARGNYVTIYPERELEGEGKLYIFDHLGNELFYKELSLPGDREVEWNLTNKYGYIVASGTYVAVLEFEDENGDVSLYRTRIGVRK